MPAEVTVSCGAKQYELVCDAGILTVLGTQNDDRITFRCGTVETHSCAGTDINICITGVCPGATGLYVYAYNGNDRIDASFVILSTVHLEGQGGNDKIKGGSSDDEILGGTGNDSLLGSGGDDDIEGEAGDDRIDCGAGFDICDGGSGNDEIFAEGPAFYGIQNDIINGGSGNDCIRGHGGYDTVTGGSGNDHIMASGNLRGGEGDDILYAISMSESTECWPDTQGSTILGNAGNDRIWGGCNETIFGQAGNDYIWTGLDPEDQVNSGPGRDVLVGQDVEGRRWSDTEDIVENYDCTEEYCDPSFFRPRDCNPPVW